MVTYHGTKLMRYVETSMNAVGRPHEYHPLDALSVLDHKLQPRIA